MDERIEIVMRKTEVSGRVTETTLASFICNSVKEEPAVLRSSNLEIYVREQKVYCGGSLVRLSYHEFFTLLYLARHPGWVLSKEQIYEAVWNVPGEGCGTAVTNVISQLRRKIGTEYIETVIGSGYKFVGERQSGY